MTLASIEPARVAGQLGHDLLEGARYCADDERKIVGYSIVAMYEDGACATCVQTSFPDTMLMNRYAFVGMVAELVRERLIVAKEVRDVVNISNGFDPD